MCIIRLPVEHDAKAKRLAGQKQRVEVFGSDEQAAQGFQGSRLSKENFSVGETGLDLSCYSFWLGAAKTAVRKKQSGLERKFWASQASTTEIKAWRLLSRAAKILRVGKTVQLLVCYSFGLGGAKASQRLARRSANQVDELESCNDKLKAVTKTV